jgi:hypothetical protein
MVMEGEKLLAEKIESFLSSKLDYTKEIKLTGSSCSERLLHLSESLFHRIRSHRSLSKIRGSFYEIHEQNLGLRLGYVRIRQWECGKERGEKPVHIAVKIKLDSAVTIGGKHYMGVVISYLNTDTMTANPCLQQSFLVKDESGAYKKISSLEGMTCSDFLNHSRS